MAIILLADDDEPVRSMLREALESAGHEVNEARNGREAVQSFQRRPTDLVITDIIMPEQEGLETIMELRKIKPDVKIIAISGGGRGDTLDYLGVAKKLGANLTLAKPFTIDAFLDAVAVMLK